MSEHETHAHHAHVHGDDCGHTAVRHEGHVDEHRIAVGETNPDACTPGHSCGGHDAAHHHDPGCGHEAVPHGNPVDYLVEGHLHHPHGDHCDDHGPLAPA